MQFLNKYIWWHSKLPHFMYAKIVIIIIINLKNVGGFQGVFVLEDIYNKKLLEKMHGHELHPKE